MITIVDAIPRRWQRSGQVRQGAVVMIGLVVAWIVAAALLPDGAPAGIVVQGAVFGTVNSLLAVGLILVYRTNRIVNFAYGSMGGVAAVLTVNLYLEADVPYLAAVGIGVAVGLALGALVERVVMRRFAHSSRLIVTVATIGLAQVLGGLELLIPRWFDAVGLIGGFETPFNFGFDIDPVRFRGDHVLIVAAVPPVLIGLGWFLQRTRWGMAVRAAAENRDRALLLGVPIDRLTTLVWVLAGGLAALTAILRAPFSGSASTALTGPTLLLPALAAAVVGRMESMPRAVAAGVALGITDQVVFWNTGRATVMDVVLLAVILVSLLAQRRQLSRGRDASASTWSAADIVRPIPEELRRLPEIRALRIGVVALGIAVVVIAPLGFAPSTVNLMSAAVLWGAVAVSLVVLTGWGGAVSLGQFGIVGIGAMVGGGLLRDHNIDLFVVLVVAGLAGGLVALLLGLPALRIEGLFLAVTTLAFAVALDSYLFNPVNFGSIIPESVERPVLWDRWPLDSHWTFYYLCLGFLAVTVAAVAGVRRARAGRVLLAARDNQRAASAAAVPTTSVRLAGFVLAGVIAGMAGCLYVVLIQGANQGTFQPSMSLEVFSMAVIGGLGSVTGALSGVVVFRWAEQIVSGEVRLIVTGAGLLFVLLALPGGFGSWIFGLRDRVLRFVADRRGLHVPSLVADRRVDDEPRGDHPADETSLLTGALGGGEEGP